MSARSRGHRWWLLVLIVVAACLVATEIEGRPSAARAAPTADELKQRLAAAEAEANSLRASLSAARQRMFDAEAEAEEAAERLAAIEGRLARGRRRSANLARRVVEMAERLETERRRLRRARDNLAERLVAIYMAGPAGAEEVAIGAADFSQFLIGAEYIAAIESADARLAHRVEQVRERVAIELGELRQRRAAAERHRLSLAADRDRVATISATASLRAGEQREAAAARDAALAELTAKMDTWAAEIDRAEKREARRAREAAAAAATGAETVERWLGGPYSIPTAIVMCESGGNYSALNPSSGAGGAYQIMPSTWEAYGGTGLPHQAPKAEQDRIAAKIWADSGPAAWVCKA